MDGSCRKNVTDRAQGCQGGWVKDEFLKDAPLFEGLNDSERAALSAGFAEGEATAGNPLFRAGEAADALILIGQGFARMTTEGGQVLATLGPGSVLGDNALFRSAPHDVNATAVGTVRYWTLSDRRLREIILQQPALGLRLGENFGSQIAQMEEYLVWRLQKTPELQGLPGNTLQAVAQQLRPRLIPAGQTLFRAGDAPTGFYLFESGALEEKGDTSTAALSVDGLPAEGVRQVAPGSIVGALPLITGKPYVQTVAASDESLIWALPADTFHAINSRHPGLRRALGRALKAPLSRGDQAQAVTRLQQMPLFAEVQPGLLASLAQKMVLQHAPAGDRVYRIGESGDALYLVEQGEIELTAENAQGVIEEQARIGANGFFGEMSVLTGQVRTEDATATRNSNLWILYKRDLDALANQNPPLGKALSNALASRLAASAAPVVDDNRFRNFEILAGLSASELQTVAQYLHPTRFRAGETIYRVNSPAEMLYLIEQGQVRLQPISGGSYVLGAGDDFGERSLLSNQPHNATALAESDVDVWTLSKGDFSVLMSKQPALAINMSRILSQRTGQPAGAYAAPAGAGAFAPGNANTQTMQQQALHQQGIPQSVPRARGQQAQQPMAQNVQGAPEYADGYGYPQGNYQNAYPGAQKPRGGFGSWFGGLPLWQKLVTGLLILLLIWVVLIAVPWAVLRLMDLAQGNSSVVAASERIALSEAYKQGTYELASENPELAQALAAADQQAQALPTYTPFPTPTPLVAPTAVQQLTAASNSGVAYTTELLQLDVPQSNNMVADTMAAQAANAAPEAAEAAVQGPAPAERERNLDSRLPALGVTIADASVGSGEQYWRLVEVRFADEQESGGKHHIYVDVIDENGVRLVGQPVTVMWGDGSDTQGLEDKPAPDYGYNYQMYAAGYAYNVKVEGLPSDELHGAGMGDVNDRFKGIHTSYYLIFQRATRP